MKDLGAFLLGFVVYPLIVGVITYLVASNMVIGPIQWGTNNVVHINVDTNRFPIEFGFRDDGAVVWRKR